MLTPKTNRWLGRDHQKASDAMSGILAQVANSTDGTRNSGNAVLYECVQTIIHIESDNGLMVLAMNILGRFLTNKDNNIRYVALSTLERLVGIVEGVQRHRPVIVECLKDPDVSIRTRALMLVLKLVNEDTVEELTVEMLQYLAHTPSNTIHDLCLQVADVIELYAPNRKVRGLV